VRYHVRWKGYMDNWNEDLPLSDLYNAMELVHEFHEKYPKAAKSLFYVPRR